MLMSSRSVITTIAVLSIVILTVDAYDPDPLQDFCVAVDSSNNGVFVNGRFCKDPETVTSDDFFFSGLNKAGNLTNTFGTRGTRVSVNELPGLNTLGISLARNDFAPYGANRPHMHPRASEIILVLRGKLYAGFISSNPPNPNDKNKLYAKILGPGDVYCTPKGLIHFQYNIGDEPAATIVSLSSQDPGVVTVPKAIFGSEPPVLPDLLTKSFQLDYNTIKLLQSLRWNGNTSVRTIP